MTIREYREQVIKLTVDIESNKRAKIRATANQKLLIWQLEEITDDYELDNLTLDQRKKASDLQHKIQLYAKIITAKEKAIAELKEKKIALIEEGKELEKKIALV